jgi:hypothetical protein
VARRRTPRPRNFNESEPGVASGGPLPGVVKAPLVAAMNPAHRQNIGFVEMWRRCGVLILINLNKQVPAAPIRVERQLHRAPRAGADVSDGPPKASLLLRWLIQQLS